MLWVLMTAALLAALMAAPIIIEIKSCRKRFFTIRLKVFGLPALKKNCIFASEKIYTSGDCAC